MLDKIKGQSKNLLLFFLLFGLAKSSVLIAPLIYSNIADIHSYGILEYAIAFAGIASPILNFGIHGAYPYFTLRKKIEGLNILYYYHNIGICVVQLILLTLYFTDVLGFKYFIATYFSSILALQLIISSSLKTHEKSNQSIFFDAGLFIALNVANVLIFIGLKNNIVFLNILILYSIALQYFSYRTYYTPRNKTIQLFPVYKEILKYSIPLVLSSFMMIFFVTSPRLLVDALYGTEKTAVYSFFFRISSLVILLHQSLNIFYFKKIYTYDPKVLDKYFSIFLSAIGIISLAIFYCFPRLFGSHFIILHNNYARYIGMYWAFSTLMVFWVGSALLENIIYRENLSLFYFKWQVGILALGIATLLILYKLKILQFEHIAFIHNLFFFLLVEAQCFILKKARISFTKVRIVNLCMLIIFLAVYFII